MYARAAQGKKKRDNFLSEKRFINVEKRSRLQQIRYFVTSHHCLGRNLFPSHFDIHKIEKWALVNQKIVNSYNVQIL